MLGDRWGATADELTADRPCDALGPADAARADRAITISAPVAVVYRWLCQLRVAPYSYDLLDNFGRRSPRTLTPGLEQLAAGLRFISIFRLASFRRDEHITIATRATAVTYAVAPAGDGTRLAVRVRYWGPRPLRALLLIGDLLMMRKQLLTLKKLAEAG